LRVTTQAGELVNGINSFSQLNQGHCQQSVFQPDVLNAAEALISLKFKPMNLAIEQEAAAEDLTVDADFNSLAIAFACLIYFALNQGSSLLKVDLHSRAEYIRNSLSSFN
jgi:hypothetical protein